MAVMNETVNEGMTCIDLGANIGYATLLMLNNVGENGFVYAIESMLSIKCGHFLVSHLAAKATVSFSVIL